MPRVILPSVPIPMGEKEESRRDQRGKLNFSVEPVTASANPTGTFGTRMSLQSCLELDPEGWAFVLVHPSVTGCQLPCQGRA